MPPLVARITCPGLPQLPLLLGETVSFGRASSPQRIDLPVSVSTRVSRRAGSLEATPYGVLVTNTGSNPLLLDETASARRTLRPGQAHLVVGGGHARVTFAATEDSFDFEVSAGLSAGPDEGAEPDVTGPERTRPAWALAEGTAYFHCLVALCEPALRYPDSPWIPTSQQVADRLYECGLIPGPRSGDWVDRRLDDVRAKLPIGERPWTPERARRATETAQEQAVLRLASGAPRAAAAARSSWSSSCCATASSPWTRSAATWAEPSAAPRRLPPGMATVGRRFTAAGPPGCGSALRDAPCWSMHSRRVWTPGGCRPR